MMGSDMQGAGPRGKPPKRPYNYSEEADEAPGALNEEPVDVEESRPAEERRSEETLPPEPKGPPVFEE